MNATHAQSPKPQRLPQGTSASFCEMASEMLALTDSATAQVGTAEVLIQNLTTTRNLQAEIT